MEKVLIVIVFISFTSFMTDEIVSIRSTCQNNFSSFVLLASLFSLIVIKSRYCVKLLQFITATQKREKSVHFFYGAYKTGR